MIGEIALLTPDPPIISEVAQFSQGFLENEEDLKVLEFSEKAPEDHASSPLSLRVFLRLGCF